MKKCLKLFLLFFHVLLAMSVVLWVSPVYSSHMVLRKGSLECPSWNILCTCTTYLIGWSSLPSCSAFLVSYVMVVACTMHYICSAGTENISCRRILMSIRRGILMSILLRIIVLSAYVFLGNTSLTTFSISSVSCLAFLSLLGWIWCLIHS